MEAGQFRHAFLDFLGRWHIIELSYQLELCFGTYCQHNSKFTAGISADFVRKLITSGYPCVELKSGTADEALGALEREHMFIS